jgi:hypothetical protein
METAEEVVMDNTTRVRCSLTDWFIDRVKPGDLRREMQRLALRTFIDGRQFDSNAFIEGQHGYSPEQILRAGQHQFHMLTRHLQERYWRRANYFMTQLSPWVIRDAIFNKGLSGFTILAGHDRQFPAGVIYMPIDSVQVMTYTMRRNRPNDSGRMTDHFDVRVHTMQLDSTRGVVLLGGSDSLKGQTYSRTVLSRDYSREPGRSHRAVPQEDIEVIDAAAALHAAIESAAVSSDMGYQRVPVLPRVYLGFKDAATALPAVETTTTSLRRTAVSFVLKWMRKGLALDPGSADMLDWQRSVVPQLMTVDPDNIEDWSTLSSILGPVNSVFLLNQMLDKNITQLKMDDGQLLELLPAAFFTKETIVAVLPSVEQIFVRVNDHLGRERFRYDGSTEIDRCDGRLQVLQLIRDEGSVGNIEFDFTSTEVGMEQEFS